MLILTSLTHALESLEAVLNVPKTDIVRDSAIQRFEYTFELSVKMLKRYLELAETTKKNVDELGYKDLVRMGAEHGCITDPNAWFDYREARNITSHAYDAKKAEEIFALLPRFSVDARALHDTLVEKVATL